jgi:putative oxidoreductase
MATTSIFSDGHRMRSRDAALLPPRATLAATMLYHGIEKLRDRQSAAGMFESIGLRPADFWARATAFAETGAGALALLGVLVRPAALAVLVTQSMAIAKVHAAKGFANHKGGFEFNLALMAIAAALLVGGPGRYSLSRLLLAAIKVGRWRRSPVRRGLRALVRLLG